jgi:hypothetical protein
MSSTIKEMSFPQDIKISAAIPIKHITSIQIMLKSAIA